MEEKMKEYRGKIPFLLKEIGGKIHPLAPWYLSLCGRYRNGLPETSGKQGHYVGYPDWTEYYGAYGSITFHEDLYQLSG